MALKLPGAALDYTEQHVFSVLPLPTHTRPHRGHPRLPAPEVLDAIARAHEAYERLEASGRHVRFDLNETSRRLAMELTDASGTPLRQPVCARGAGTRRRRHARLTH